MFPIGSLFKILIPFYSLFLLQYIFFKIAKRLFESHGETVKFLRSPQICVLVHRSPLAQHMVLLSAVAESTALQRQNAENF
jgi:hypothetical protein